MASLIISLLMTFCSHKVGFITFAMSVTVAACMRVQLGWQTWKCLLAPFLLEFVSTPIYVMNSAYDAWQIENNEVGCVSTAKAPCDDSSVQQYGSLLKQRVRDALTNNTSPLSAKASSASRSVYLLGTGAALLSAGLAWASRLEFSSRRAPAIAVAWVS